MLLTKEKPKQSGEETITGLSRRIDCACPEVTIQDPREQSGHVRVWRFPALDVKTGSRQGSDGLEWIGYPYHPTSTDPWLSRSPLEIDFWFPTVPHLWEEREADSIKTSYKMNQKISRRTINYVSSRSEDDTTDGSIVWEIINRQKGGIEWRMDKDEQIKGHSLTWHSGSLSCMLRGFK